MARVTASLSRYTRNGAGRSLVAASIWSHWVLRLSRSHCSSSAERPTPAVRTMAPMPSGICSSSMTSRIWSRSSPSMRRETPPARGLLGISTRKRPARLMNVVRAAPLLPRSSFSTWTMTSWPFGEQLADVVAPAVRLLAEVVLGDFLQRQEAVALRAVVDEAGFERGLDAGDPCLCRRWLSSVPWRGFRW